MYNSVVFVYSPCASITNTPSQFWGSLQIEKFFFNISIQRIGTELKACQTHGWRSPASLGWSLCVSHSYQPQSHIVAGSWGEEPDQFPWLYLSPSAIFLVVTSAVSLMNCQRRSSRGCDLRLTWALDPGISFPRATPPPCPSFECVCFVHRSHSGRHFEDRLEIALCWPSGLNMGLNQVRAIYINF